MKQANHKLSISTRGKGLYDVTGEIMEWVSCQEIRTGLLTVFIPHTSASLVIQENADPDVLRDLNDFFSRIAPETGAFYRHNSEGPDDMPAHIRAALTQTQLSIPVQNGKPSLGVWQGIYLFEHRTHPHTRNILLHLLGD